MEVHLGVASLLDAFVARKAGLRVPMRYVGLAGSAARQDWLDHTKGLTLREKHRSGELQVAGNPTPSTEMLVDSLEGKPAVPILNQL